jgi:hypothetical protein
LIKLTFTWAASMATSKDKESTSGDTGDAQDMKAVSNEEVCEESSKAASAAFSAQTKARELRDAAGGTSDPEERQKLMERAIDKEIEAESFGKTAKYLRSGAFQGMAVGAGLGMTPSATLGALTGTLVGGVTSVITGGIGGGIGAAAGAVHGPIVNMGELAGKGVRKATGDLPGWVASKEQKQTLEKMISQIKEEDMPNEKELQELRGEGDDAAPNKSWMESAKGMLPSIGDAEKSHDEKNGDGEQPSK